MSEQTQAFDTNTVNYIAQAADEALAQMATIAAETRYSTQYKNEQLGAIRTEALGTTDSRLAATAAELEAKIAELENKVKYQPVLSSEVDIQKLNYTREALAQSWQHWSLDAMVADWNAALERGDKVHVQVYLDFAQTAMIQKNPVNPSTGTKSPHSGIYERLAEQSRDMLSTPEQLQARRDLAFQQQTLLKVKMAHGAATVRLKNARLDASGKLPENGVQAANFRRYRQT